MRQSMRPFVSARALGVIAASTLALAQSATAAIINYGTFAVPSAGVTFVGVTESSGTDAVPLFGPPAPFAVGLDFDPATFVASSTGAVNDVTSGQLNFTVQGAVTPNGVVGIDAISLFEAGDFSLAGAGTSATQAIAGAIARVTVLEINGVPVAPITLAPSSASVAFNLVTNPGAVQPWSLGTSLNILGQLPANSAATRVEVIIDDDLLAISQAGSVALIAKKDFQINVTGVVHGDVPEPSTAALASIACFALTSRRRNRSATPAMI